MIRTNVEIEKDDDMMMLAFPLLERVVRERTVSTLTRPSVTEKRGNESKHTR